MRAHRPVVLGSRGVVAAGHHLAGLAGINVLQAGGNAVDAAVASAAVMSVVNPAMSGLGGDVFMLIYTPMDGQITALNGSGAAPQSIQLSEERIPERGLAAATVPGAVAGWADAVERYGSLKFSRLFQPAIEYAEQGFRVSFRLARALSSHEQLLAAFPSTAKVFLPGRRSFQHGDVLVQPDLARTLRLIADQGSSVFYTGELAARLSCFSMQNGGFITEDDLACHRSVWAEPLLTKYRGQEILAQPPVSQGLILLQLLNVIESDDLARLGQNQADCIHLMVEANKLAFAQRDKYLGDPDFVDIPINHLISKMHGRELRAMINPHRAAFLNRSEPAGNHTTYLAVADRHGIVVSLIQSLYGDFGCGTVAEGTGIFLNNRLSGFSPDRFSPNRLAPGKRPVHTLNNCMVLSNDRPKMVLGSPGADGQIQFVFQILVNLIDFSMELQQSVEAPRWRSEPERVLKVEARLDQTVQRKLRALGHDVVEVEEWAEEMGGAQVLLIDQQRGVMSAAADPRREGYALAW